MPRLFQYPLPLQPFRISVHIKFSDFFLPFISPIHATPIFSPFLPFFLALRNHILLPLMFLLSLFPFPCRTSSTSLCARGWPLEILIYSLDERGSLDKRTRLVMKTIVKVQKVFKSHCIIMSALSICHISLTDGGYMKTPTRKRPKSAFVKSVDNVI